MPESKTLTANKKDKLFPIKLKEQDHKCILCNLPFEKTIVWNESCCFDHLNDKRTENQDTNVAVVHIECNLIKRYNIDYKLRADDWKVHLESQISLSLGEREGEGEKNAHTPTDTQTAADTSAAADEELTESQINLIVNHLALSQLEEFIPEKSTIQVSHPRILANIHYLLTKRTKGRGSEQASRRALNALTKSEYSPWEAKKLSKGNIIIQRRILN